MKRLSLFAAILAIAMTVNAKVYDFSGITANDITAAGGTVGVREDLNLVSVSTQAGVDVDMTFAGKSGLTVNYTNSGAKEHFFLFYERYMYVNGKNAILSFSNVTPGDTIKLIVAAKGSTNAKFHAQAGVRGDDQEVTKIDNVDDFATVTFVANASDVQIKETNGGFNITKAIVGGEPVPVPQAVIPGPISAILAGGTPVLNTGISGSAINRGGFIVKDDGIFFCNGTTGRMFKADLALTSIEAENDSIGKGYYMDYDDGGNIIIYAWTAGSGALDVAQVYNANYELIRNDSLGLVGRCDMPTLAGNMVSGRGAYFAAANSATKVLRYNYVDGVATSVDSIDLPLTLNGNSSVAPLDVDRFYVQSRGNGLLYVDCTGAQPVVTNMPYFSANTFTSAYGGKAFEFAGHKLYVMGTYKVGQYGGSIAVFDVTDPANPVEICADPTTIGTATMGTACVTFRVIVDEFAAHIYEYARFHVRKYDLTAIPARLLKQGSEGAEWIRMTAGENVFTLSRMIYEADSLYINTDYTDEGAVKYTRANMTYHGDVVTLDTVNVTYDIATQAVTIDSVGKFVPKMVFNVKVPAGTPNCYIAGTFSAWERVRMAQLTDTTYTYTATGDGVRYPNTVEYKYCADTAWACVEVFANGDDVPNRHWAANDTVIAWKALPVVQKIVYELNGGVTNDYGWTSKGAVALDLQDAYNAAYNASKAWAKLEDGVYYFMVNNNWVPESQAINVDCTTLGFIQNVTYNTSDNLKNLIANNAVKFGWLKDVMIATRTAAGLGAEETDLVENVYRKEISAIMLQSPSESNWPVSADYSIAGAPDALLPIWKHAFANPERVNRAFKLNAPYKEGFTFDGWYATSDFSGEKITQVDPSTPSDTLYAKWIEYIQTIEEVKAAAEDAAVKTRGTVNYVNNKNLYIQDASGAILIYLKAADSSVKVGDVVTISGVKTLYGGAPEIMNAEITSKEAGTIMPELTTTISALVAAPLANFGKRVYVEGVTIAKYDNQSVYVTDGTDTVCCYKVKPAETAFPVGMKVNMRMIAGYHNGFQFVGFADDIEAAPLSSKDPYLYPARGENNEYTLTNKWLICDKLDNYSANRPAATNFCRGMAAKDGKMYFINRANGSFTVVDGATGAMLDPLYITGDHLFEAQNAETGEWKSCVELPYNDVKFDNAGHCLIASCSGKGQRAMVYVVDLATGAATELINERLLDNPENYDDTIPHSWRMDAIGVYGDVTSDAIVMFGNSMNKTGLNAAYRWDIKNGVVAGPAERIDLVVVDEDDSYMMNNGELVLEDNCACQVFPVGDDYFYWDHHACRPTLFTMDGVFADDLKHCPTKTTVWDNPGDTTQVGAGHNGICEFQIGGDYFVVMAATNNVETPASSFALFKYANEAKSFAEMTPLWYFPAGGMGAQQNTYRTAVPSVEVKDDVATIYLYAGENGYGVYEMKGILSGINNVDADATVQKVLRNGHVYIIKNGVEYSVLGVQVK